MQLQAECFEVNNFTLWPYDQPTYTITLLLQPPQENISSVVFTVQSQQ